MGSVVPFLDLKAQYASIRHEVEPAVNRVLESAHYVLGPEVEAFEREFAAYCNAPHAVAVELGDERTAPGAARRRHRSRATRSSPCRSRSSPPPPRSTTRARGRCSSTSIRDAFTIDPSLIEAAITPRTRAIMPVHLYGQTADMDPILEIAQRRGLTVIEDAAQAHGAEYKGRRAGSMGDFGCFSFYPGKNLGACGEGGLVTTRDAERARTVRMLRDWGQERKYAAPAPGLQFPHGRDPGRDPAGQAAAPRGVDGGPPGRTPRGTQTAGGNRRSRFRRKCGTRGTSITSTPSAHPTAKATQQALHAAEHSDGHPLSDSRAPSAGVRLIWAIGRAIFRKRKRPRARCCRCRCIRNWPKRSRRASRKPCRRAWPTR